MLYVYTDKIRYSTAGASFKVTLSVAPEEIGYLQALCTSFKKMNMCGIPLADYKGILDCVSQTETQMKTQNSNLTFEMSDEPQTESNKIGCSFCENKDVCIDAFTEVSCLCSRYDSAERSE